MTISNYKMNVAKLFMASILSTFGSSITIIAFPVIAVSLLNVTPTQMGVLVAASTLPYLVFGPVVGVICDRLNRKMLLIGADLLRALAVLVVPMFYFNNILSFNVLLIASIFIGLGDVIFDICHSSVLPSIFGKSKLVAIHSKLEVGTALAKLAGPGGGGFLIQVLSAPVAIIIDAITYAASAFFIALVNLKNDKGDDFECEKVGRADVMREMATGFIFIFKNTILFSLFVRLGLWQLISGGVFALLVMYMAKTLQFDVFTIGLMFSLMSLGLLVGSLIAPACTSRFGVGTVIVLSNLVASLSIFILLIAEMNEHHRIFWVASAFFIYGVSAIVYQIGNVSIRQYITPDNLLGRMNAANRTFSVGLNGLGAVFFGYVASVSSITNVFFALGVMSTMISCIGISARKTYLIKVVSDI